MALIFIWINSILYIALGIWCAIQPRTLAPKIGFLDINSQGLAEFVAVYGGLEFALGLFFAYCAVAAPNSGIVLSTLLYCCLVLFRLSSVIFYDSGIGSGWNFFAFEALFAVISLYLVFTRAD